MRKRGKKKEKRGKGWGREAKRKRKEERDEEERQKERGKREGMRKRGKKKEKRGKGNLIAFGIDAIKQALIFLDKSLYKLVSVNFECLLSSCVRGGC